MLFVAYGPETLSLNGESTLTTEQTAGNIRQKNEV